MNKHIYLKVAACVAIISGAHSFSSGEPFIMDFDKYFLPSDTSGECEDNAHFFTPKAVLECKQKFVQGKSVTILNFQWTVVDDSGVVKTPLLTSKNSSTWARTVHLNRTSESFLSIPTDKANFEIEGTENHGPDISGNVGNGRVTTYRTHHKTFIAQAVPAALVTLGAGAVVAAAIAKYKSTK